MNHADANDGSGPGDHHPSSWLDRFAEPSELGGLVARHDWAATPLGDPATWPDALRAAVTLCLASRFPILVVWGPELIKIYNDGYRVMLGDKHPASLGAPVREVWPEIWHEVGPLFETVMSTGTSTWAEHQRLDINRRGFLEACYFTYSYTPIIEVDGHVGGVIDLVTETTAQVLSERRLRGLRRLAAALVTAREVTDACRNAVTAMATMSEDLPSAELLLRVGDRLVPVAATARHLPWDPETLDALLVPGRADAVVLDESWDEGTPANLVAVNVGDTDAPGVLIVGANLNLAFDEDYRSFVELTARTIGTALEESARRSIALGVEREISQTLQDAMLAPASNFVTVAARYIPAAGELSVGGDWYDVIDLGSDRRALVVGDCVGHGLTAATVMGQLRNVSRALLLEGRSPSEVLASMDTFARSVDGAFCTTMACAVVDRRQRTLVHGIAGHVPPLLVKEAGDSRWLGGGGPPLGVGSGARTESTSPLDADDLLVLYTDGLIERRGESIDVGLEQLRSAVVAIRSAPVETIADRVTDALVRERPADDVALVVKRLG